MSWKQNITTTLMLTALGFQRTNFTNEILHLLQSTYSCKTMKHLSGLSFHAFKRTQGKRFNLWCAVKVTYSFFFG